MAGVLFMAEEMTCFVCESKVEKDKIKKVDIKGKTKNICNECATTITGLM